MTRHRIKRIGVMSTAIVLSLVYAVAALITAVLLAVAKSMGADVPVESQELALAPVIYGVAGFIGGLLLACIYNMVAAAVGGIVIDLAEEPTWEG